MSLEQLAPHTWMYTGVITFGVVERDGRCILIETGAGEGSAKKCHEAICKQGWQLAAVLCTHAHADHIGGHAWLQNHTEAQIYATIAQRGLMENALTEAWMLFGASPPDAMRLQFLEAKPCRVDHTLAPGLVDIAGIPMESMPAPGHSMDSILWRSPDGVVFGGDALFPQTTVAKYKVSYYEDVIAYRQTMEALAHMPPSVWVWAHAGAMTDIRPLIAMNRQGLDAVEAKIVSLLPATTEDIMARLSQIWDIPLNMVQYHLLRVSVQAHLVALQRQGRAAFEVGNRLVWQPIGE